MLTAGVDHDRSAPWSPSLRRSVDLFRAFRREQSDPDFFYRRLASDSAAQVSQYADLDGAVVLDVGGGPGYFADAFRRSGASYVAVDVDAGELSARGGVTSGQMLGSGLELPVRSDSVDVCYSSNVLEHVETPERFVTEMVRVTRPGGIAFVSYTLWWSPWGGHETAPWHYLGGEFAARRYRSRHGVEPKNRFGRSLYPVRAGPIMQWASSRVDVDLVDVLPRYHPSWARWVVRAPGLRELVVWNLVLVMRKR